MEIAILFTGGKDSTYTVYKAIEDGFKVKRLITIRPKKEDSYMFHTPSLEFAKIQAELMNIEHVYLDVSGEKEVEVEEAIEKIKDFVKDVKFLGIGGIRSKYQLERFEKIAKSLNLKLYVPLLNIDCIQHWKNLLSKKFKVIITSVNAYGLDESFLAKIVDEHLLNKLIEKSKIFGFDLCFEGGEAETLVLDCPLFSKEIVIEDYEIIKENLSARVLIKKYSLKSKL
ncbi:MAG: diphthine--ammonia ligase [Candidatus Aenigmatarchaeota archaeon]